MKRTSPLRHARVGAIALLAAATLLGTSACASGSSTPTSDGILTVSQAVDVATLDPQMQTGTMTDMNVLINIYDCLTVVDDKGAVQPGLATSWTSTDGMTWEFKLRKGVTFQDGEPFNAAAVKYTYDRINDPKTASPLSLAGFLDSVTVVDDYTVDFKLAFTDPILPAQLSLFIGAIVPPKYIAEKGDAYFAEHPVGTGPFEFVSWKRGDRVTLKAYKDYWGGEPKVKELVFRNIPSTADALAALKTGEIDMVSNVDPDSAAQVKNDSKTELRSVPGTRTYMISLDADHGGPLQKQQVRQALNEAVDVSTIIKTLRGGHAQRVATTMPSQSQGFDSSVEPYSYDPADAKKLLAAAGYPNGFTTTLSVTQADSTVAQAIVSQLADVGVTVNLDVLDPGTFEQELTSPGAGKLGPMFFLGNTPWTLAAWSSFQGFVSPGGQGMSRFTNAEADKYWNTINTSVDQAASDAAAKGMQKLLKDEAAFLSLYQADNLYAVNKNLDWTPNVIGLLRMHDAKFSN